ncbi:MAG TPA: CHAT domain-containing protein [Vicinamibacterales bacterium]|nr:CHAT domain-containing protein [Vicinamibacterales bacterium]
MRRPLSSADAASFVREQPLAIRELVETEGLVEWAERARANSPISPIIESNLRSLGTERTRTLGDRFLQDVAEHLNRTHGGVRDLLIRGHIAYGRGRSTYDRGEWEQSAIALADARRDLASSRSPFEYQARLLHAVVLYQLRRLSDARAEMEDVRRQAVRLHYAAIEARAQSLLGLVDMQQGRVESAIARYEQCIAAYDALREFENVTSVASTAADTLRTTGDRQRGWRFLLRASRGLPHLSNLQREYLIEFNLSLYAQDEGLLRAAEVFQRAAMTSAETRGAAPTIVESHLRHAQLELKQNQSTAAQRDLEDAASRMQALRSPAVAAYLSAWRERVEADLVGRSNPQETVARLESLVSRFETTEPAEVPAILLDASRASQRAGDPTTATRLLRQALDFIAGRRTLLRAPEYRLTYFAAQWDVLHDLIGLEFAHDPAAALATAESARRALMTDASGGAPVAGAPVRLPANVAVLYFVSLEDRLLLWTITVNGTMTQETAYGFNELADDVDAFRRAIESGHERPRADLERKIFDHLFGSALDRLGGSVRTLLIAADGAVGDLPVAALTDPRRNEYLFERYDIAFVPSLAVLSGGDDRAPLDSVLAVGFNGAPGGGLPVLAAAEREAEAVAGIYRNPTLLTGGSATPAAVRAATGDRRVVHIAAHARANRLLPWRSQLVLASTDDAQGSVDFDQVATWDLHSCQLVVLSACETAAGARVRGEGVISLAFPFLTAGARVVVGTLWDIDDRAAEQFMRLFHAYVAGGQPAIRAMALARKAAIASQDPELRSPAVWGAYVVNTRVLSD